MISDDENLSYIDLNLKRVQKVTMLKITNDMAQGFY
jgi:hypothetical protein